MELSEIAARLHKLELVRMLAHRQAMGSDGLYFGQMPVLDYVHCHPGCTQIEIAEHLQVSPASIALSTKRLQRAGYLTKEVDADNLRRKRLFLSDAGEEIRCRTRERMDELDARAFAGFSDEELRALVALTDRVTLNLTGEKENVVDKETFSSLHRELEKMNEAEKRKVEE